MSKFKIGDWVIVTDKLDGEDCPIRCKSTGELDTGPFIGKVVESLEKDVFSKVIVDLSLNSIFIEAASMDICYYPFYLGHDIIIKAPLSNKLNKRLYPNYEEYQGYLVSEENAAKLRGGRS